jgi:immune inhibitor A
VRKVVVGLLSAALASGAGTLLPISAVAAPPVVPPAAPVASPTDATAERGVDDDLPNPLEDKRRALRQEAVADVVSGRAKVEKRGVSTVLNLGRTFGTGTGTAGGKLPEHGKDQYVELAREKTDKIFVILAEFGNERHPDFPDKDVDPNTAGPVTFDGPLHNRIPKPDRTLDNTTNWQPSYPADHFRKLYFGTGKKVESLRTYYETQSSGRYSVNGKVTDWVKVKYNEARYGRSGDNPNDANGDDPAVCDGTICDNSWALIRDAANQWVADQQRAGRSETQIATDLASFDRQDRYDFDGDGNFNEPDGYFDHFQIVFAGTDEADYNQFQGEDGLWSHRWFAYYPDRGKTGPAGNKQGGTQLGNTGLWIGDYTMQPENGGLGTLAHEYAHDLGLPDDYDTSGRGGNNQSFWTLMANNRLSKPGDGGFDTRAGDLGAWNKLQLGWLDYETVVAGQTKTLDLGPQEYNTAEPQAVVVVLPRKKVPTPIGAPYAGTRQYHSGNANNLDTTMTRQFDLTGRATAALSLKGRFTIESGYDFLYVEASDDDGRTWKALDATVNGGAIVKDATGAPAISGTTNGNWVDVAAPLDGYAGRKVQLRLHYRADGTDALGGFFADDIKVVADGAELLNDGAETATTWTLKGFTAMGSDIFTEYDNYYIAGHRSYVSYDKYLKAGPYVYAFTNTRPRMVDHFPFQPGLLVSYWDTSQRNNNTNEHHGSGLNLFVDSRPAPMFTTAGATWRTAVQAYDMPFSLKPADSLNLHVNSVLDPIVGLPAVPTFDDTQKFFYEGPAAAWGVKLPAVGVKMTILKQSATTMQIKIS